MMKKINVDIFPFSGGLNPYIDIIKESVSMYGKCDFRPFIYSEKYYLLNKNKTDVVYLNWYDNIQASSTIKTLIRAARRIILLKIIKFKKISVVFVVHNRIPHDCKNTKIIKWFMKKVFVITDKIVVLSNGTCNILKETAGSVLYQKISNKIEHVPHPSYFNVYPDLKIDYREKWKANNGDFIFLFFGTIKPYKNVELLLKTAGKLCEEYSDIRFIIAGKCSDSYLNELNAVNDYKERILIFPDEINDSDITSMIKSADIVILPLDVKSSLNSTTCYLTFSCGKNIVCPRIATLQEFSDDYFFDYTYETYGEHEEKLYSMAKKSYLEKRENLKLFAKRENAIIDELREKNSSEMIGRKLNDVFVELKDRC